MNHLFKIGSLVCVLLLSYSCAEVEKGQYGTDNIPPSEVANCKVANGSGEAVITYDLPADDDLLYVRAAYKLDDGRDMEVKASAYVNELKVVGFGRAKQRDVRLTTFDRSGNESQPVTVSVSPADNPIYAIFDGMEVSSDFGGLALLWDNPTEQEITITVTSPDEVGMLMTVKNFYTKSKAGVGFVRGYSTVDSEEKGRRFALSIKDHWGNETAVKDSLYYPIYEEKVPSDRFAKYVIPGTVDPNRYSSTTDFPNLWNNSWGTNNNHYHTKNGLSIPINIGIDMGRTIKLSRLKYYQRSGGTSWQYLYAHGNPKRFRVWGSPVKDGVSLNVTEPGNAWKLLSEFTSVKPSGLPLGTTNADDQMLGGIEGEDVLVPINATEVRWIRVEILETWGGVTDFCHIAELTFYGKLIK